MIKNISKIILFLIIAILLNACGTQEPTVDPNTILTQVILSVEAGSSQTALAAPPTNTPAPPSPTAEPTETPTQLIIPTSSISETPTNFPDTNSSPIPTSSGSTQIATATQAALATATSAISVPPTATITTGSTGNANCYKAIFLSEVDPYDNQALPRDIKKNKMWQVTNTGTCAWTDQFSLVLVASIKDGSYTQDTLGVSPVIVGPFVEIILGKTLSISPGESVWITIDFTTPSDPGIYELHFKLQAPDGTVFGIGGDGALWVIFQIK